MKQVTVADSRERKILHEMITQNKRLKQREIRIAVPVLNGRTDRVYLAFAIHTMSLGFQRAFEIHICIVEGEILLCPRLSDQASQWESDKRSVVVSRGEVGNDTPTTRQEAPRRSFRIWQPWDLDVSSSVLIRTIER
ncbi:hypothetical protein KCV06_g422, partial [Aureobasidium melanogenum]